MISALVGKVRNTFELVKFSHTVFALPFALASMLIAANGLPSFRLFFLVVAAMVTARNCAMSFNRLIDASLDAENPRTANRQIPQGILSKRFVFLFGLANAVGFVLLCGMINRFCLYFSPAMIALLIFYSYTKRFTAASHLVLGFILGLSPVAAWIAVRGTIDLPPVLLGAAVLFWVAGFDILYATQDLDFDKTKGLHSIVVRLGLVPALRLSKIFHLITLGLLFAFGRSLGFGGTYYLTLALVTFLFGYEHSLVSPKDLSRVNAAFFNVNGVISLIFLAGVILSLKVG